MNIAGNLTTLLLYVQLHKKVDRLTKDDIIQMLAAERDEHFQRPVKMSGK